MPFHLTGLTGSLALALAAVCATTMSASANPNALTDVSATWGEVQPGPGSLNGARRLIVPSTYPDATGVCFDLNGDFNRCDATGPKEGSEFHFYPTPSLEEGDLLTATWTDRAGTEFVSTYMVPGVESPPPTEGSVEWQEVQPGPGSLSGARRVAVVTPYPDADGVCFSHNDDFNRCDATGPNEGSAFHFYPTPTLAAGDLLSATWVSGGVEYVGSYEVQAESVEPPAPPASSPPASTDAYTRDFETQDQFDDFEFQLSDGRSWNDYGKSFSGDHAFGANGLCGSPDSQRPLRAPPGNTGTPMRFEDHEVRNSGIAYWCLNGTGHIMTALDTTGYAHLDFTPRQVFADVTRVCWDQNITDMGGKWTEMAVVPQSTYDANGRRMDYTNPTRNQPGQPGGWGLQITDGVFKYWTDGRSHTSNDQSLNTGTVRGEVTESRMFRASHCVEQTAPGIVTVSIERQDGTVYAETLPGTMPTGEVRVIFSDVSYNPSKRPGYRPDQLTWHWDSISID